MQANIPVYLYKNDPTKSWNGTSESATEQNYIHVMQGEANSEILNFHLFIDEATPLNLTDKNVTFYFTKPDGTKIFLPAEVPPESADNGIALVTLTAQCTAVSGLTKDGVIRVADTNNHVLKFSVPNIYIVSSNMENAVESTSEFHALDIALDRVAESLTAAEAAAENAQSVLESDRKTLTEITAAVENASSAAQAANTAAENATSCAQAASDAAATANLSANNATASAQHAETAAQVCEQAAADMASIASNEIAKQKDQANGLETLDENGDPTHALPLAHNTDNTAHPTFMRNLELNTTNIDTQRGNFTTGITTSDYGTNPFRNGWSLISQFDCTHFIGQIAMPGNHNNGLKFRSRYCTSDWGNWIPAVYKITDCSNINTLSDDCFFTYQENTTGAPSTVAGMGIFVMSGNEIAFEIVCTVTGELYFRVKISTSGNWNSWVKLATG